mgnify:CR=1 FL=1|jgi:hypothetical protein
MLNVLPQVTGIFVSRHLKISYSAAVELASLAFWNGLRLRLEVSTKPKEVGTRSVVLRLGGLSIRLERLHTHLDLWISRDGRCIEIGRDLTDMREVLKKVRTTAENYQRTQRPWWAVVPTDRYQFIKFL